MRVKAKSIMVQGTASDSGKSTLVTGLCRYYKNRGLRVFPFKSQNMASNSAFTLEGKEISKAQITQAEAAGLEADIRMNPIFLRPSSDTGSDVILNGEVHGHMSAMDYTKFKKDLKPFLRKTYEEIEKENDLIILEGAGSPAEINLQENDLVNMGMAEIADCPVILVADIDLGGVFASIYGTVLLQKPEDRERIKGIIINKFRGDVDILRPGLDMIEDLTGIPVIGVVPYSDIHIEEEDSVSIKKISRTYDRSKDLDLAILSLKHIGNFSDYNSLKVFSDLSIRFIRDLEDFGDPDLVILPDSTNPGADLAYMKELGFDEKVVGHVNNKKDLIALGASAYLLGQDIDFGPGGDAKGLGIFEGKASFSQKPDRKWLALETQGHSIEGLANKKAQASGLGDQEIFDGYGYESKDKGILATDLIGLFDNTSFMRSYLNRIRERKGLGPLDSAKESYKAYKERAYEDLAQLVAGFIDMEALDKIIFG